MLVFENPHALWLLLILPLLWWLAFRTSTTLSRIHLSWLSVVRTLVMLSIVVGLSQPVVRYPGQDLSVVYALDASRSVSPEFLDKSLTWVDEFEQKHSPSSSKIIVFGENLAVVNTTEEVRN